MNDITEGTLKLQNFSKEHLCYEISMLYEVTQRLAVVAGDDVTMCALTESFSIHAAIILDFLLRTKNKPDDAVADDYLSNKEVWQKIVLMQCGKFDFIWARRNKEIAHLSYGRLKVTLQDKPWNHVAITREISDLVDMFISVANKELLHAKVFELSGVYKRFKIWKLIPNFQSLPMRNNK